MRHANDGSLHYGSIHYLQYVQLLLLVPFCHTLNQENISLSSHPLFIDTTSISLCISHTILNICHIIIIWDYVLSWNPQHFINNEQFDIFLFLAFQNIWKKPCLTLNENLKLIVTITFISKQNMYFPNALLYDYINILNLIILCVLAMCWETVVCTHI